MQRTNTRATAGVQDGVRALVGVIALHIDERQLDGSALRMFAIFRYDQKPASSLVEAVRLVDTVTRLDTRKINPLRPRYDRRYNKQTDKKESDHCFLLYSRGGVEHLSPLMHDSDQTRYRAAIGNHCGKPAIRRSERRELCPMDGIEGVQENGQN